MGQITNNRILIAEDSPISCEIYSEILSDYDISFAYDGKQAIDIFDADTIGFDIVILDVSMPEKDGYEVCSFIRNHKNGKYIKIFMVSASIDPEPRKKGLIMGADDYIGKPFDIEEFKEKIRGVMSRDRLRKQEISSFIRNFEETTEVNDILLTEKSEMGAIIRFSELSSSCAEVEDIFKLFFVVTNSFNINCTVIAFPLGQKEKYIQKTGGIFAYFKFEEALQKILIKNTKNEKIVHFNNLNSSHKCITS
jgi:DNA-binding response OmpR family regulator